VLSFRSDLCSYFKNTNDNRNIQSEYELIFTRLEFFFLFEGCRNVCVRASSHISGLMTPTQCMLVLNSNHHRTQIIPVFCSRKILQSNSDKKDEEETNKFHLRIQNLSQTKFT